MNPTAQYQTGEPSLDGPGENVQEAYTFPLSFAQQRIWLLAQLESHGAAYHLSNGVVLRGALRVDALERALNEIVARHEALRTTFALLGGEPVQVVVPERRCELPATDLRTLGPAARDAELRRLGQEHAGAPFDLAAGPLARFRLVRMEDERHVLLCTMHHLVTDGWSEGVFQRELAALYRAFSRGDPSPLPELPIQYGDFAVWERDWLQGEALDSLLAYWKEQLAGAPEALELPTDRPRPAEPSYRGAMEAFSLPAEVAAALEELGRSEQASLYSTLLAAFGVLLHRRSGQDQVLVGSPVANRGQVELEGLIGLFLNTVVMRVDLAGNPTFRELLRRVREVTYGAQEHQNLPFEKLLTELRPVRDRSRNPLFQVFFNLENAGLSGSALPSGELGFEPFQIVTRTAKLDLILNLGQAGGALAGSVEYSTDLFDAATVRRMLGELRVLLEGIVASPDRPVGDLPLLDAAEIHRLVEEWNATERADYPRDACIHELFEVRAARHPDAVAVAGAGEELTYGELNRRADRLAHHLAGRGVGPEVPVAVCMERSPELVVAVLGVLKAGGAYLPMDPGLPEERARYLLADAGARLVLTRPGGAASVPGGEWEVLSPDAGAAEPGGLDGAEPGRRASPDNLAYLIYTSGSTGRPKGVMVPHRGVVNYLSWCLEAYPLGEGEGALLHGSVAVDMSVTTLFAPLLAGRAVVLLDADAGVEELGAALRGGRRFSFVKLTPTHLQVVAPPEGPGGAAAATAALVVGGEALFAESLAPWRDGDSGVRVVNEYGPTETVVGCCAHEVGAAEPATGPVPIGRPIANTRLYVLDASLRPVPVGVAGELYVGGAQVTRGYLGRPELTAERFLPDPFSPVPGARVYRTGDLARHRPDGALEYLGRADQQVKIRGYRVEPGEIEAALLEHPSVREAAVLAREDVPGERRLVAYLAADGELAVEDALAWLRSRLPEHMLPGTVVRLDRLPLTPSGKVDRRALPAPVAERPRSRSGFVAPRTPVEEVLAAIWSGVLQVDAVGVHDNFFTLGGDSIRSLMVAGRAREKGLPLSIRQIARTPTIAELAAQIQQGQTAAETEVHVEPFSMISPEDRARLPEGVVDAYPLARMQLGMLYHMERMPNAPLYHSINSHHLRMVWDRGKFEAAVLHITERHANLRTSFDLASYSQPLQLVYGEAVFPVGFVDLRHLSESEQMQVLRRFWREEKERPFDFTRPPLLRFHIHQRTDDSVQFTLTETHAIVDGWSLHIIYEEILTCYFSLLRGEGFPELPELKTSFRDFIYLERKAIESGEAEEFWRRKLAGYSVTRLPRLPGHRPDYNSARGLRLDRIIPSRLHARLRRLAREESVPLKSVLLAAHLKVMSFLAGEDDIVTGLSSHGRLETSDAERVGGLFLNTLPIRFDLGGGSWRELVRRSYEAELELLPVHRYPIAEVQSKWGPEKLYDTSFVYLNFHAIGDHARSGEVEYVGVGAMIEETEDAIMTAFMHLPGFTSQVGLTLCGDRWIFTDQQIRRIEGYYFRTMEAMVSDPDAHYETFAPFSEEERGELAAWSAGGGVGDPSEPVHRQFERQAALAPDAPCLDLDGEIVSFSEVDRRANRIAHGLRLRGVGAESRVAVAVDRAPEQVAALLGVLKAGAAFVPVDPSLPEEQVRSVLRDSGAAAALTLEAWRPRLAGSGVETVCLDGDPAWLAERSEQPPAVEVDPASLAYVAYAPGAAGRTRGVAVEHRQLAASVAGAVERLALPAGGGFALISTFAPDPGITMLFPALCTGGCLHVVPEREAADPEALAGRLSRRPVDCLHIFPSHLGALLAHSEPARLLPRERLVLEGGAAEWELVDRVQALAPGCRTFIHYEPGETAGGAVAGELQRGGERNAERPPLGFPLAGTRAYVLDAHLQPVPVGTAGALCIGGVAASRGYLGQPALTAETFFPDPFSPEPGARMYATGDLVRRLADGRLELLGRLDDQVRIHGSRLELHQAEAALREHPAVAECTVVARQDGGGTELVGYVVAATGGAPPTDEELRAFLARALPATAVPARFVRLEALPRTPDGRVDRGALPALEDGSGQGDAHVEPRTPIEEKLIALWKEVLDVDRLGVYDSFFDLGGDSIRSILAAARVRRAFGVELSVDALFGAQTVAGLAGVIEMALQAQGSRLAAPIVPVPRDGELPLSSSQQRFWYAHLLDHGKVAQNIPIALRLRETLDTAVLQAALDEVVRRHEVLRTRFPMVDGVPRQVIEPAGGLELRRMDLLTSTPSPAREEALLATVREEAWAPFDLERGPLLRGLLVRVDDEDHVLVLTTHHVVFDGWSVGLFLHEIGELYTAFLAGRPSPLPELAVQYADYAAWQHERFRGEELEAQVAYWRERLAGAPTLELPTDRLRPEVLTSRGGAERLGLSQAATERLRKTTQREGVTLFMSLLAAYAVLLHHRSGAEDIVVGSPVATHRHREELQGVIGSFQNTLALRIDLSGDPSFREMLRRVRRTVLEGFSNQELPFDRLVDTLGLRRDVSRTPVFQVLFNHSIPGGRLRFGDLKVGSVDLGDPAANFELELVTEESGGRLVAALRYNADLFEPATARELLEELEAIVGRVTDEPDRTLSELRLALEEEARTRRMRARSERDETLRRGLQAARRKAITIQN